MPSLRSALKFLCFTAGGISLSALVGCGGGSSTQFINNTESFSNANLKGSYVYQLHGGNALTLGPYRETGVFTADGAGNITGGSDDISQSATGASVTGSYQISLDGTGSMTITGELGTINLAITMVSNSKVYLMEADNLNVTGLGADANGVAELQDPTAAGTTPAGSFAFRIHEDVNQSQVPAALVGAFTVPGSGVNGAMDQNVDGTFTSPNLTWTFGAPGSLGRGTGTFLNASTNVTSNFVYYIVNSSKIDLLMSDTNVTGAGSAEAQSGAIGTGLSGTYAFGSSGDDSNALSGFFGTVASVGEFNASGGNISGTEDTNVDGTVTPSAAINNCYSASANGRVTVTNLSGSTCSSTITQVFWMVNPSRAFFLDVNSGNFDDGSADLQTASNFSASTIKGQFALVMGGFDASPEQFGGPPQLLSRVGVAQFDGTGKIVINELANASDPTNGSVSAPGLLSGTYTVSSNGRITAGAANANGGFDFVIYAISGSQGYALQDDAGTITSGTLERQP
ncbi:MAG TPA: hypothetical protein VGL74_02800 [Terriglobales bacterium]|jgi:hypothetical protein